MPQNETNEWPLTPSERLRALAAERSDYMLMVGIPLIAPREWAAVSQVTKSSLVLVEHGTLPLYSVRAFLVAYPNGQLLDCELCGLALPPAIRGLKRPHMGDAGPQVLQWAGVQRGNQYIRVEYGRSTSRPHDPSHYSTTLTNMSAERINVQQFGGYRKTDRGWMLSTVTGKLYNAEEFRQWYGLGSREWILPGRSATDFNNYGSPPMLWAYFCQAESGEQFIAGSVIE